MMYVVSVSDNITVTADTPLDIIMLHKQLHKVVQSTKSEIFGRAVFILFFYFCLFNVTIVTVGE